MDTNSPHSPRRQLAELLLSVAQAAISARDTAGSHHVEAGPCHAALYICGEPVAAEDLHWQVKGFEAQNEEAEALTLAARLIARKGVVLYGGGIVSFLDIIARVKTGDKWGNL
jgi:hypothetical protein